MSRSFMVCVEKKVMNTATVFLVYSITKLGYFSKQHISVIWNSHPHLGNVYNSCA